MSSFLFQWQPWRGRMGWVAATARRTATTPRRRKGAGPLGSSTQGTACWDQVRLSAPDPDLAFQVNPDPDPGFWWSKIEEKNIVEIFKNLCWSKIAIYLSQGLHNGRPSYRRSLQPSKENIQHFKKWNFFIFFTFVVNFCPPGSRSWIQIHNTAIFFCQSAKRLIVEFWITCPLLSVADPGCLSRIPDPDFYPSRIPDPDFYPSRIPDPGSRIQKQQQKREVKKISCCHTFYVATNFTKL